jgi:hypothetical protein
LEKGIAIWVFTSLTFVSLIHLIDSAAIIFSFPAQLLKLYPIIHQTLQQISLDTYLHLTAASTTVLWVITSLTGVDNSVEGFLNRNLSDAKTQTTPEAQILESKSEIFYPMYEIMESDSEICARVKDLLRNKRVELKGYSYQKKTWKSKKRD